MDKKLSNFVTNQTARLPATSATRQNQLDPKRVAHVYKNQLLVSTSNVANSGQQRHEVQGKQTSRGGPKAHRGTLEGSEYEDSTVASVSGVKVEDSQVDHLGRPVNHPAYGQQQPTAEDAFGDDSDDDHDRDDEEQGEYEEYDAADRPNQEDFEADAFRSVNDFLKNIPDGGRLGTSTFDRPQDGDSYPDTTSGNISQKDIDDMQEQYAFPPAGRVVTVKNSRRLDAPAQKQSFGQPFASAPIHQPQSIPRRALAPQGGRSTTPPGQPAPRGPPGLPNRPATTPAGFGVQATPLPSAATHTRSQPAFGGQQAALRSNSAGSTKAHSIATIVQAPAAFQAVPVNASPLEAKIEVDMKKVYDMPYEALHKQSLDEESQQRPSVLTEEDAMKPFPDQLQLVQKMDNNAKQAFLASLTLDQWEEAGDWFLERFGDIVTKLKDARKERRKLAKGFGDEIFARHQRVQGKKRTIQAALDAMGKSGEGVLKAGTPKKARLA